MLSVLLGMCIYLALEQCDNVFMLHFRQILTTTHRSLVTLTTLANSDSMVQPQMDQDWFTYISNLDLVELNRIRD